MRLRTALAGLATLTASAAVLSPLQAQAAAQRAPGELLIQSSVDSAEKQASAYATPKGEKDRLLPFHSWVSAELHHCDGTVTDRIGWVHATRDVGKPWRTYTSINLGFDVSKGPFKKWVVKTHSKGRATVATTVTSTDAFTLGCSGEYQASEFLEAPERTPGKPLTANYKVSATKALASRARFGKVTGLRNGRVVAGTKLSMKGAGTLKNGKLRAANCQTVADITFPGRPALAAAAGRGCNKPVPMPKKVTFWNAKGVGTKASLVGKRVYFGTQIEIAGHQYAQYTDLGKVVKK